MTLFDVITSLYNNIGKYNNVTYVTRSWATIWILSGKKLEDSTET